MTRKQFNAREFERELVDAGYMPLYEYIRRWGDEGEALSSRAVQPADWITLRLHADLRANFPDITEPKANAGECADD